MPGRGKRLRSVKEDHGTIQQQVSSRHPVHLRVIDIRYGEDGDMKMLPLEAALEHLVLVHGPDPCSPANSSTSDGACSRSDPCVGLFLHTVEIIQGILVMTSILQPSAGSSTSSSSTTSPGHDSANDYPKIGGSTCWNYSKEGCLICMVAPNEDPSHNSSSKLPTIGRSEASNARTPSVRLVRNLNPYFNVVQFQTILESIHRMALEGSPLVALAQQGAETTNLMVAERSAGNPPQEPYIANQDWARHAQSEAASLVSSNHCLANNDVHHRIT
jgi:hypothetical protein